MHHTHSSIVSATATKPEELTPPAPAARPRPRPWRFSTRSVALRLFLTCWLVYTLHFATNTVREIFPALSLGDHLSFDVSEYIGLNSDIFELPDRGAFINSNPGASIMGAIPYAIARPVIDPMVARVQRIRAESSASVREYETVFPMRREFYRLALERGLDVKFGLAAGVMQVLLMAPLSALSVVVMFYLLLKLTSSVRTALLLALLYAFATPVFYRTAQLNQNLLVAHCALFAFVLLWRPWDDPMHPKRPCTLLAGLLCGWAVVLDYSGLVVVAVLGLYMLVRWTSLPRASRSLGDILHFAIGVAISGAVLLGYQWLAFGHPLFPAQHYMPPARFTHFGYRGMDWPKLDLLWMTAFGMRYGLFTSAPLLLLALFVPVWLRRDKRIVGNRETWFIVIFVLAFFLFSAANQYGRMQFNTGVRHVVPVTPFLFLLAASVLLRLPKRLALLVAIVTTYWSWCLAMYRETQEGLGIYESLIRVTLEGFRLPWLTTLELMGYISSATVLTIPFLVLGGIVVWALWNVRVPGLAAVNTQFLTAEGNKSI